MKCDEVLFLMKEVLDRLLGSRRKSREHAEPKNLFV